MIGLMLICFPKVKWVNATCNIIFLMNTQPIQTLRLLFDKYMFFGRTLVSLGDSSFGQRFCFPQTEKLIEKPLVRNSAPSALCDSAHKIPR